MRVALILSGQIRTFDVAKCVIQRIKDKYPCDVFMGIDPNNLHQNEYENSRDPTADEVVQGVKNFVGPVQSYVFDEEEFDKSYSRAKSRLLTHMRIPKRTEPRKELVAMNGVHWEISKLFDDSKEVYDRGYVDPDHFLVIFRQYFLVNECYKMLLDHIKSNSANYDVIVRLRFDQIIWSGESKQWVAGQSIEKYHADYAASDISFVEQETNTISVFGCGQIETYAYANDQFWTHGMDLVQNMSTFYDNLPDTISRSHREHGIYAGGNIEHYFLRHLLDHGISLKKTNLSGQFVRGIQIS